MEQISQFNISLDIMMMMSLDDIMYKTPSNDWICEMFQ